MFKPRVRRIDSRANYPEHVVYAAYLYPTVGAFRMFLRGLSFDNLMLWREQYRPALSPAYSQALQAECVYREMRPHMRSGGKDNG